MLILHETVLTDNATGLMWQDDATGSQTTWQDAIDRCEALSLGVFEDWRFPNVNELTSLVDDTKYTPSMMLFFKTVRLTIIGRPLPMLTIVAMHGLSISTMVIRTTTIRAMTIMCVVLEQESRFLIF